jgi:glycerol-3-phosphate dehydrogenase (NAD(P)+)
MGKSVAVIGGGAWGSAISASLTEAGHEIRVLTDSKELTEALLAGRSPALGDEAITPPKLATMDLDAVIAGADAVFVVVPASATADVLDRLKPILAEDVPVAFAAKGFEPETDELIPHFAATKIKNPVVMFSGPSFADEVARGKPAALVAASTHAPSAKMISGLFAGTKMRVYISDDPIGVAVGGAVKNVVAIASGIAASLKLGDNTRAALITRGLAEATHLAVALGGRAETLFGLAGLGDMVLTCSGPHSRNFAFGMALGEGSMPSEKLAEGRHSCAVIARRAEKEGVEMPITAAVDRVVSGRGEIDEEIKNLMERPVDSE